MSAQSKIEWTDRSWNPVRGCSVISPGCHNCYAMKQAHRFSGDGRPYAGLTKQTKAGPQWTGKVVTVEDALLQPLAWRKPQRVFVNSMSDLFHEDVPSEFIDQVFAVMTLATKDTFQILTKRADRMLAYMTKAGRRTNITWARTYIQTDIEARWSKSQLLAAYAKSGAEWDAMERAWPLPNVWLGVSGEDQRRADERIPLLRQTPAAVRFVSAEPLLEAVDLSRFLLPDDGGRGLDWVICGGESGPGARPCNTEWLRQIVMDCRIACVPAFVKQLGSQPYTDREDIDATGRVCRVSGGLRLRDRKGGDIGEFPTGLRVREFPDVVVCR